MFAQTQGDAYRTHLLSSRPNALATQGRSAVKSNDQKAAQDTEQIANTSSTLDFRQT